MGQTAFRRRPLSAGRLRVDQAPNSHQAPTNAIETLGLDPPPTESVTTPRRAQMAKVFECERDGAVIPGEDEDELVVNVERHVAEAHPDLVGKLSREQILAGAKEA